MPRRKTGLMSSSTVLIAGLVDTKWRNVASCRFIAVQRAAESRRELRHQNLPTRVINSGCACMHASPCFDEGEAAAEMALVFVSSKSRGWGLHSFDPKFKVSTIPRRQPRFLVNKSHNSHQSSDLNTLADHNSPAVNNENKSTAASHPCGVPCDDELCVRNL